MLLQSRQVRSVITTVISDAHPLASLATRQLGTTHVSQLSSTVCLWRSSWTKQLLVKHLGTPHQPTKSVQHLLMFLFFVCCMKNVQHTA